MPCPSRRARFLPARASIVAAGLLLAATPAAGQELALKEADPGSGSVVCPERPVPEDPGEEARAQALQLGSEASQAVILGDLERARDLLERATQVDPTSAALAYRHGRLLEDAGEVEEARAELCRVVSLDSGSSEDREDARRRLEAMAEAGRDAIPEAALEAYRNGVARARAGFVRTAEQAFAEAVRQAPEWAEAHYNHGVILARLGRRGEAVPAFRRYLELSPGAPDALAVSQRIGSLETTTTAGVGAGTALTLGLVLPGMGQFSTGRPLPGFSVMALAGGALATGFLVEEVQVECLVDVPPGGECPPGQAFDEDVERPYLTVGIGAAALVTLIGAIEAYVRARRPPSRPPPDPGDAGAISGLTLAPPTLTSRGSQVRLSLLRLRF